MIRKNEKYTVIIEDLSHEGYGVTKINGFTIFVENALPSEEVEIQIVKVLKRYGFGKVIKYIRTSKDRVEIKDSKGYRNGTMPLQHLSYPKQLEFKRDLVIACLNKYTSLKNIEVLPIIGMENPWNYRNKAQIPVKEINGKLETGFYKKNSHDLIPIDTYYIQEPDIDELILKIRDILRKYHITAYNEETHQGILRHIIIRRGHVTKEIMVILVTNTKEISHQDEIVTDILDLDYNIVSIIQNINMTKGNVIMGQYVNVLYGNDIYRDELLGKTFEISSKSFYQVNSYQTEVLYKTALDYAEIDKESIVLDAYSGIGTIGIIASDYAMKVYGVEVVEDAIKMAHRNEVINKVTNTHYEAGKAEDVIQKWYKEGIRFDVVIVDPPRKGLDTSFIETVVKIQPKRIVYVSCNPSTLARDLEKFVKEGYKVEKVQPVDMFPQTIHVETVVRLYRKNSQS